MTRRIDRAPRAEITLVTHMRAGIKGRQHDDIVARRVQFAIGFVSEPRGGQYRARLQLEVLEMKYFVIHVT